MTVKDIFDLRKQGMVEEAYEAIRPMYATHKGKYTTLCMFWTASDMMKKRLQEGQTAEAAKIFEALMRILPNIDDSDGKGHQALLHGALRMKEVLPTFSMLDFISRYGVDHLTDSDWKGSMSTPKEGSNERPHPLPSTAQRLMTHCFHELQQHPDSDHAAMAMPLMQEASRRMPRDKHTRRYLAVAHHLAGDDEKAAAIYRELLKRSHDSYLYAELAEMTSEPGPKTALMCQAIMNQRQEKFCTGYRLALVRLLAGHDDNRAAYELERCIAIRQKEGYKMPFAIQRLQGQLNPTRRVTDAEQRNFYRRMAEKYPV